MPHDFENDKDMVRANGDHHRRWLDRLVSEPSSGKPKLADRLAEYLNRRSTTAKRGAGTTFGVVNDHGGTGGSGGFNARVTYDRRCYLVGASVLAFCLAGMLGFLLLHFKTASHVAINSDWCSGFSGLSCTQEGKRK